MRRLPHARRRRARGDGRRSAVRGHGTLRQAADPPRVVRARASRAAAQLLRAGRAPPARSDGGDRIRSILLAPRALLCPLLVIATLAAVIASQALISGAFSLTQQSVQLGYSPRVTIVHTSKHEAGQIYIPEVNKALMVGCLLLVVVVPESRRARRGVRHRRHGHDGDHVDALLRRRAVALELVACCTSCSLTAAVPLDRPARSSSRTSSRSSTAAGCRSRSRSSSSR